MTDRGLFSREPESVRETSDSTVRGGPPADRRIRTERSALWAAYGDALGWISELTDERGLARRTSGKPLRTPIKWKRRIGGPKGITASLPCGCYSDDSQLRLATGRAIRPTGFDVEAFAKVELPVWLSYGLGGGKSTSAAAANLARPRVPWFYNTFKGWCDSGGNGAAMRVQPHVWAARSPENAESFLLDVMRNAVCTHSHPTGLMGAVLHSLALAQAMTTGRSPAPRDLTEALAIAADVPRMLRDDTEIGQYWLGTFEQESGSFHEAWSRAVTDCERAIRLARETENCGSAKRRYAGVVDRLGLREPAQRGSGILTAVAASALSWCEPTPQEALEVAVNSIGTDTDTIASMAGAILGATAEHGPPVDVLDVNLFRSEAARLAEIACGGAPRGHDYPDPIHWSPPSKRADCLALADDDSLYVRGLGRAKAMGEPIQSRDSRFQWQWLEVQNGQTLFIKRRERLVQAPEFSAALSSSPSPDSDSDTANGSPSLNRSTLAAESSPTSHSPNIESVGERPREERKGLNLGAALKFIAARGGDDRIVGEALRRVVNEGTPGELAGFTAGLVEIIRRHESAKPLVHQRTEQDTK